VVAIEGAGIADEIVKVRTNERNNKSWKSRNELLSSFLTLAK
jgi:hypothetical protein